MLPFAIRRSLSVTLSFASQAGRQGLHYLLIFALSCQPLQAFAVTKHVALSAVPARAALTNLSLQQQNTLTLSPTSGTHPVGGQRCLVATYTSTTGQPLRGASVSFAVAGANATTGTASTDWAGQATFCYTGASAGTDTITASVGSVTATATQSWRANALIASESVIVRHGFIINSGSRVEGSVRQLLGESTILNSGAVITQDLLVPGTPQLVQNGTSTFGGTVTGTGSTAPTNYQVTLNSGITLGKLRNRVDPTTLATVAAPPAPTGTRSVTLSAPNQSIGDPATLRNLTLNSNVGQIAVPPGTYGNFIANSGSGFTFGVAGATQPVTYNLTNFTLNSSTQLQIVSPVILVLANGTTLNAAAGTSTNPGWLLVKVAAGAVTLNSGSNLYGGLVAPASTVTLNANSQLIGNVTCDRLMLNGNCLLRSVGNQAPLVTVGASGNQTITLPTNTVNLSATISDDGLPGGAVSLNWSKVSGTGNVTFSSATSSATNATFTAAGTYVLRLTADDGALTSSDDVVVTVIPANQPPLVNAGADQTLTLPTNSAALAGNATDDGFPAGSTLALQWSKISGAGTVTFSTPTAATTTATFSSAGSYTLRLTASDGVLSASDDMLVTVNVANQAPSVNAGTVQTLTLGANLLLNPGNEFALVGGQITNWQVVSGSWTQAMANTNGLPAALLGTTYFAPDESAAAELRQDVNVASYAAAIASGTQLFAFNGWVLSGYETPTDSTQIIVEYRDPTNTNVLASYDAGQKTNKNNWQLLSDTRPAPIGTGWIRVRLLSARNSSPGNNGYFDQLTLRPVAAVGATLNGTASDDGLPTGSALATTWSKVSGPDPMSFANPNAPQTTAAFTNAGTYVLRLTATDSVLSASSNVTITVNPGNVAPSVSAGTNQTITLPNTVTLNGTATDDGKPSGSSVATRWSLVSGSGAVTFANASTASTTAGFSAPGTYVLRLAADDTDYVSTSEVTITVQPQNLAPVVNAGPDVSVALPNSAVLNGTATDDGQPTNTLTIGWSKVTGPGTVTFSAPNAAVTTAAFSVAGTYTLRLTASDGVLTTTDDVIVTVSPANQAPLVNAGADQLITFPNTALLTATATDDGLPTGNSVAVSWSKVSGPGTVSFTAPTSLNTSATFSVSGVYTLRLTASDGALSATDDVVITVNQPPTVNAGTPQTVVQNGNLVINPSADGSGGGGLGGWSEFGGSGWGAIAGGFGGALGGFYFQAANAPTAELQQQVNVAGYATFIDAGQQSFDLRGFVRSGAETPADSTRIIFEFRDAANATVLGSFDSGVQTNTANWQAISAQKLVPTGTRYIRVRLLGVRNSGTTNDAFFDGISVRPSANTGVLLNGTTTDDGLGGTLSSVWSKVSGPGNVTFANPASSTTSATFDAPGTYVLQLTATDTNATTTSTVTVTVAPPNQAPTVNAGANQTIALPVAAALNGSVTDDGLPTGSAIESKWSVISGPGTVTFTSVTSPQSTAGFSQPGSYVLRLTANDTDLVTTADITITVLPPNQAPVANAGADQLIAFPNAAQLQGTATDDGYPQGSSLTVTWSKVSGLGSVSFVNANALSTNATFSHSGVYTLRLTATDGALTSSDEIIITVNQAPSVNAGTDVTVNLPNTITLAGTATDDNLPSGNPLTMQWEMVSGPAPVTFATANSANTSVTLSAAGAYVLRLTVSDGQLTSTDEVAINAIAVCAMPANLVAWWPGNTNFNDLAGNNPGVASNGTTFGNGVIGQGGSFDGVNDAVTMAANTTLQPAYLSVEGWIKFDSLDAVASDTGLQYVLFQRGSGAFESFSLFKLRRDGVDRLHFLVGSSAPQNQRIAAVSTSTIQAGQFYHVVGTYDGTNVKIYLNGNLETTQPANFAIGYNPSNPFRLGGSGESFDGHFKGIADEVKLYNRALDAAEVQSAYQNFCPSNGNRPPLVNAGPDRPVALADALTLQGVASDDGQPIGSTLAINWTKISGPGAVTFATPQAAVTNASFSAIGTYVLRLSANDSSLTIYDDVTVTVVPGNQAPVINAGADQTLTVRGARGRVIVWHDDQAFSPEGFTQANTGARQFALNLAQSITGGGAGSFLVYSRDTFASTRVPLTGSQLASVMRGAGQTWQIDTTSSNFSVAQLRQYNAVFVSTDKAYLPVLAEYVKVGGTVVVIAGNLFTSTSWGGFWDLETQSREWNQFLHQFGVNLGYPRNNLTGVTAINSTHPLLTGVPSLLHMFGSPVNPFLLNNPNLEIVYSIAGQPALLATIPQVLRANLVASVTDDGLPGSSNVAVTWSKISGTGSVTFSTPNDNNTQATFSEPGIYVLRITATDGALTSTDDIQIAVRSDLAPALKLDKSRTIVAGQTTTIAASVFDDFQTTTPVNLVWSKTSGPGSVTFSNPNASTTDVTFAAEGAYVLRLTANDSAESSYDELQLYVVPATHYLCNTGDDFSSAGIDPAKWNEPILLHENAKAEIVNGRLELSPAANYYPNNSQLVSRPLCDLTNKAVTVEVIRTIQGHISDETYLVLRSSNIPAQFFDIVRTGPELFAQEGDNNRGATQARVPFDAVAHRFWRISHRQKNDTIRFETSPDGVVWTTQRTMPRPSGTPMTGWYLNLAAASWTGSSPNPGKAIFDNLTITTTPNWLPTVALTAPTNGSAVTVGNAVTLSANAADNDGTISKVDFYANGVLVGTDAAAPYSFAWTPTATGVQLLTAIAADDDGGTTTSSAVNVTAAPSNQAPVVNAGSDVIITLPALATLNGTVTDDGLPAGSTLTKTWSKVSGPGTVTFSAPTAAITNATFSAAGTYTLRLTANDGQFTASDDVVVTVNAANQAPVVNAGSDVALNDPANSAALNGSVTDDGLPTGSGVSVTWSKVSGPGAVVFSAPNAAVTNATFSTPGAYTLRLTASDSALTASDDVVVNINQAPVVNAGADATIPFASNLVQNPGNEAPLVSGQIPNWTVVSGNWTQVPPGTNGFPASYLGNTYFYAGENATAELRQDVDVAAFAAGIAAGTQQFDFKAYARVRDEAPADKGKIIFEFRDATNTNVLATITSADLTTAFAWEETSDTRALPTGTRWIRVRLQATRNTGTSNDAYFDQIAIRPVNSAGILLAGTATDDNLPVGSSLAATWTKMSGPGTVAFASANSAATAASFSALGVYTLRLTGNDSALSTTDDVVVTVTAANQPPTANAGPAVAVTIPNAATLNGSATDDGLPAGATLGYAWSKVSGAGNVTFTAPNAATTNASFSAGGTYVLRLTVNDSEYVVTSDVTVTVTQPVNQAPVVSAGADKSITLPTNTVQLDGTATDDGLPVGSNLQIVWNQVSGPNLATFSNANGAVTSVSNLIAGTYTFRLNASDGALTSSDDVIVTVIQTNQPPVVNAGADQTITLNNPALLSGTATDDGLPAGSSVSVTWSKVNGPGTVTFANPAALSTTATFSQAGVYQLRLTASDSLLTASDDVIVTVNMAVAPPTAALITPLDDVTITERTDITGVVAFNTASANWKLEYALNTATGQPSTNWTQFATGNTAVGTAPGTGGLLAKFDPTLLLNGSYSIRLTVTDDTGQTSTSLITATVEGQQKVGVFSLAFDDVSLPLPGLPVNVIRSYDSRNKQNGDFGVGWQLALSNVRVEKTGEPGFGWTQFGNGGLIPTYQLQPTKTRKVVITFPDGRVYKFTVKPNPAQQQAVPITGGTIGFTQIAGSSGTNGATLEPLNHTDFFVAGGNGVIGNVDLYDVATSTLSNPTKFKLTTAEKFVYVIDQTGGVQTITDPNGNVLSFTANGITHSAGTGVTFTRDAQGRITQITDADNKSITYTYNTAGDLASVTDREGKTTQFTYDTQHNLKTIIDPSGQTVMNNGYDADGRLMNTKDAFNQTIAYNHDLDNHKETITDRLGNVTVHEYDARGNVTKTTDAKGGITTYTYDSRDNQLTMTNNLGKTWTYTYDASDNKLTEKDPLNNTVTYTYNNRRQPLTITDARGNTTTNTYDNSGNLTSTTDALNHTTSFVYNPTNGQRTQMTDSLGNLTKYEYDTRGYLNKETDAQNHVTLLANNVNGNVIARAVTRTVNGASEMLTTSYEYDAQGRLTKTTAPDGTFTRVEYNANGQQSATIDQLGRRTEYTYDAAGRVTNTKYADLTTESATYDLEGRRLTSTDRLGRVTNFVYDELGRQTKTIFSDGSFTETIYDAIGRVIASKDVNGNVTTYEYDPNCGCSGRKAKITDANGKVTMFSYDANANQIAMTDALNHTTSYEYDQLNRRTKTIFADASFSTVVYDALGRTTSKTDQAGKATSYEYDALGRLTKVTDALNQMTTYSYDEIGNQLTQTDANNHTTTFEYDKLGRRVKRKLPAGQIESYAYNSTGTLATRTDFNGKVTTLTYDAMNRLLSKTPDASFGAPAITFTYNALGQRLTMNDVSGATTYDYDVRNRLSSKQTPQGTLTYTYDNNNNVKSVRSSNANGYSVNYNYDTLSRLQTVMDNNLPVGSNVTNYSYDDVGNLSNFTTPNGVVHTYTYNTLNRLTNVGVNKNTTTLASYAYSLGAAGNRLSVIENNGRTVNYAYDNLYRLTSETIANATNSSPNGTISYSYDPVGNRLSRTSSVAGVSTVSNQTFDANDRLATDSYDANGNTIASTGNGYGYDFENRLITVNVGTANEVRFTYDGDGNRVSKTANGVITKYLVDTNNLTGYAQVVDELQGGNVTRTHTYGHARLSQRQFVSGNWQLSFYGYDGHNNVRVLTDNSGGVTDTYDFDAFGNLINSTGTTPNEMLYCGEQFDQSIGFYNLRARWMNSQAGRFFTIDNYEGQKHRPQSQHLYIYVENNPVSKVDPTGHVGVSVVESTYVSKELETLAAQAIAVFSPEIITRVRSKIRESSCLYGGGLPLYRSMKVDVDGFPLVEDSRTGLGVRTDGKNADITPDAAGNVVPLRPKNERGQAEGLSVSPLWPFWIPKHNLPKFYHQSGGKDVALFCINSAIIDVTQDLHYEPDEGTVPTHGVIEPSTKMSLQQYRNSLASTRTWWILVDDANSLLVSANQ